MVELGDEDLVAGRELAADRLGEEKREGRHVGAVAHLVGVAADEVGRSLVGVVEDLVALFAGCEGAVGIGVVVDEVVGDGVDHALDRHGDRGAAERAANRRGGGSESHAVSFQSHIRCKVPKVSDRAAWAESPQIHSRLFV